MGGDEQKPDDLLGEFIISDEVDLSGELKPCDRNFDQPATHHLGQVVRRWNLKRASQRDLEHCGYVLFVGVVEVKSWCEQLDQLPLLFDVQTAERTNHR